MARASRRTRVASFARLMPAACVILAVHAMLSALPHTLLLRIRYLLRERPSSSVAAKPDAARSECCAAVISTRRADAPATEHVNALSSTAFHHHTSLPPISLHFCSSLLRRQPTTLNHHIFFRRTGVTYRIKIFITILPRHHHHNTWVTS